MNVLKGIINIIQFISEWSGRIFSVTIMVLLVFSCYEVFTRQGPALADHLDP